MKNNEIKKLKEWCGRLLAQNNLSLDAFDIDSFIDDKLNYHENKNAIRKELKLFFNAFKQENIKKRKDAEIISQQEEEQKIIQHLAKIEEQAELQFSNALNKISLMDSTETLEEIYHIPKQYTKMVARGNAKGFLMFGDAGLGKSHSVIKSLKEEDVNFKFLSGHITPLELYTYLFQHRKEIIVLDDVNILENEINLNILKASLGEGLVSYNTSSSKLQVPSKFNFEGSIIMILNSITKKSNSLRAVESRILEYELKLDYPTKIKVLYDLAKLPYPSLDKEDRKKIAEWIKDNTDESVENLNLRLMFQFFEMYKYDKDNWERLARARIKINEEVSLILQQVGEKNWCEQTGKHRATYYRIKKEILGKGEKVA